MRILHVNDTKLKLGGTETYMYDLMEIQKEAGHDVKLFGGGKFNTLPSFLLRFYNPLVFFRFLELVNDFKPDIIHAHNVMRTISPSVLHVAKLKRIPVVMTVHDFQLVCPTTWFIFKDGKVCKYGFGKRCFFNRCYGSKKGIFGVPYNFLQKIKVLLHRVIIKNNVDFFITPSRFLSDSVRKSLQIDDVQYIPHCLKIKKSKKVNIPKEKTVLFVGRISEEKGVEHLVRIIPSLLEKIPDLKFVIVGSGPEEVNIRNQIKSLGVEDKVGMVCWVDKKDVNKFYRDSSMVVIPSIWTENFGMVAVEAMSQGKPIIVSKFTGGLKEHVKDGVNGYCVNVKNIKEFSSRIIEILSDGKKLKKFSEKSLKFSEKYLDKDQHLKDIEGVYRSVIG
jgi:glycosyltransferase involved in cell wall biosynthesis